MVLVNMPDQSIFAFVSDLKYRRLLENDYNEILKCIESGCYKSATTLSGSIIEALLTDFLLDKGITSMTILSSKKPSVKTEDAGLYNLINYCNSNNMITNRVYHLLEAIRDFRNLIHPSKAVRMGMDEIRKEDTILYQSTLAIILKEISDKRQKEFGSTSEQLLNFILYDEYGVELFYHMARNANSEDERRYYLTIDIPKQLLKEYNELNKYYEHDGELNISSYEEEQDYHAIKQVINRLYDSYHICYETSNRETRTIAANKMIEILKYGSSLEKSFYTNLFEEDYYDYIDVNDKHFYTDYLVLHSRELSEKQFNKFLKIISQYTSKEQRKLLYERGINSLRKRNYREIIEGMCKFLSDIKQIDQTEYDDFIKSIQGHFKDSPSEELLSLYNVLTEILIPLNETVPNYAPF